MFSSNNITNHHHHHHPSTQPSIITQHLPSSSPSFFSLSLSHSTSLHFTSLHFNKNGNLLKFPFYPRILSHPHRNHLHHHPQYHPNPLSLPRSFRLHLPPHRRRIPHHLADIIRYHILLRYVTFPDLRRIQPPATLITTLLQTIGRAPDNLGSLNVTFNTSNGIISFHPPKNSSISSNILSLFKTVTYNLSIFTLDSLLFPYGLDLMASETRPQPPGLNITRALIDDHDFDIAASMLLASGVVKEFEEDEGGAGITLLSLLMKPSRTFHKRLSYKHYQRTGKSLVLKFHVLHSYYPLDSLESIVNPVQSTLATEDNGAGSFTLNISLVNTSVAINTRVIQAVVTQIVFDQNPVAIFGGSSVITKGNLWGRKRS